MEKNFYLLAEHGFFLFLGLLFFGSEDWLYDVTLMWNSQLSLKVFVYYYLYISRYVVQTKQLDGGNKEYYIYLAHHVFTVALLVLSFFKQSRIGVTIAVMHEAADMFLLPGKICYRFYETRNIEILNTLSYALFIIFVLVYFHTRIYWNGSIIHYIREQDFFQNGIVTFENLDYFLCAYLLHLNLLVQLAWQFIICRFLYSITSGKTAIDEKDQSYFKKKN